MPIGRSLHVGINQVSPAFPNAGILTGPENDAVAMRDLAEERGFVTELIRGQDATSVTVVAKLLEAAAVSQPGDIFLFTFAGHGTGEFDPSSEEDDNQDEALLLYDGLLFDDQLSGGIWPNFQQGVRVLMIADSCHSGTVAALILGGATQDRDTRVREISQETRAEHLKTYRHFYRQLAVPVFAPIAANVLLLAACGDLDTTPDGDPHGVFTAALLQVIQDGKPKNYADLIAKARQLVGPQVPQLTPVPPIDQAFIGQVPFTI